MASCSEDSQQIENPLELYKLSTKTSSLSLSSSPGKYSQQSTSSTFSPQSLSSCTQSSIEDPSFIIREPVDLDLIEMPFSRVVSTHKYCCLCGSPSEINTVPSQARLQSFQVKKILIPKGNRCCPKHIIKGKFYADDLELLKIHAGSSMIEVSDLTFFLHNSISNDSHDLKQRIGDGTLSDHRLQTLTGFTYKNLDEVCGKMTSMRNSKTRSILQALVVFLFKMRTGNSNSIVASVLGLDREQQVSDYCTEVINSFEKDILPDGFGYFSKSREELIENQTSETAKKLYDINDQLLLIFDGTYIRHQKSTNNMYQRKSYSGQKKAPLCKPFTICTSNGYVVEMEGPFYANQNDAEIMKILLEKPDGLQRIMKPGDICVVDRGFRDVVKELEEKKYRVFMPALKGKRSQLTTEESNDSRWVTKVRWVVEAVHGIIGQKYKILHHNLDNKLLPKVQSLFRIACYLNNTYGKRLNSDVGISDEVLERMKSRRTFENSLAEEAETQRWNRRKTQFQKLTSADLLDFPELTERELKILFTGSYQLSQAVSYLAEMMDEDGHIPLSYSKKLEKETNEIIQILVRSRHITSKTYKCYIDYTRDSQGASGIRRYSCDCPNGKRTIGCCSHIAAVIYYLSHARYLSKIIKPAEILTRLFDVEEVNAVINSDSDED
ncbi:uncharacterized protein LOC107046987 [Diachasma alloeum]|uniref:uncharacterized protein LOC107046987 n=1 Tax=Diachasma alloeum TaxID=454923 RepID=UPI000738431C|nr:uncharacterized protein LOC107046987 [Diachasma alloeum]